ncbi:MAG: hypothetical protein AABY22_15890 [Nanoarchaeota archaeon]
MNKKGQEVFLFVGIMIAVIIAIIVIGYIVVHAQNRRDECKQDCTEYNAVFVDYESGGHSNEECWCKKSTEPLRIW